MIRQLADQTGSKKNNELMVDCIFCRIIQKKAPAHIVYEDRDVIAFLDKYPQSRGHLQLVPKIHVNWVYDILRIGDFFTIAGRIIRVIIPVLGADHVTLAAYGQEIKHAHLWIVPQYRKKIQLEEGRRNETGGDPDKLAQLLRSKLGEEVSRE